MLGQLRTGTGLQPTETLRASQADGQDNTEVRDQTALPQGLKDAINNGTYSYSPRTIVL